MKRFILITALVFVFPACAPKLAPKIPDTELYEIKQNLSEAEILERIEGLKYALMENPKDYKLRRVLAVYYNLVETPHSRLLAIEEIDRAIELSPTDPELYIEKGRINISRRFYGEAEALFRKALELDPKNFQAYFELGSMEKRKYIINMRYPVYAASAAEYYIKAVVIDPTDEDALRELITLNLLIGDNAEAEKYVRIMKENLPRCAYTYLLSGIIDLEKEDFNRAENKFEKALDMMSPLEKSFYSDISAVIPEGQYIRYNFFNAKTRDSCNRDFWINMDPTPTTDVNERLLEHYKRVYYARYLFQNPRLGHSGPYTDRGRSLIKYGMPDYIGAPFYQGAARTGDASMGKTFKRKPLDPTNVSVISWDYSFGDSRFKLYFLDEFLNGDYHIPIDSTFIMFSEVNRTIEVALPEVYDYPIHYQQFGIHTHVVQRRGGKDETAILLSTSIPGSESSADRCELNLSYSIRDSNNDRIYRDSKLILADSLKTVRKGRDRYMLARHLINLIPRVGDCSLHITCVDSTALKRGINSEQFKFIDFSTDRLIMSEMSISLSDEQSSCSIWPDGNMFFPAGSRLCLAYEIYNLELDSSHKSEYELTYSIIPFVEKDWEEKGLISRLIDEIKKLGGKEGHSFITNSITQSSYNSSASDRLVIDTGSLKEGKYILSLRVNDLIAGENARRQQAFILTGPFPEEE